MAEDPHQFSEYLRSKYNDNTRDYAQSIVEYLNQKTTSGVVKSIKSKDLQDAMVPEKIEYIGVFYRLLKELCDKGIIIKTEGVREPGTRGKNPVFYKLNLAIDEIDLMTIDELKSEIRKLRNQNL